MNTIVAGLMALVTGLAAWRARWFWAGVAYAVCAVTYASAVLVTWAYHRRDLNAPDVGLATERYYVELLAFYDRQVRFLASVVYWYGLPLLSAVALVGYAIWLHTGSAIEALLIGAVVPVVGWIGIRHANRVGITDLHERRRELAAWLDEVGVGPRPSDGDR